MPETPEAESGPASPAEADTAHLTSVSIGRVEVETLAVQAVVVDPSSIEQATTLTRPTGSAGVVTEPEASAALDGDADPGGATGTEADTAGEGAVPEDRADASGAVETTGAAGAGDARTAESADEHPADDAPVPTTEDTALTDGTTDVTDGTTDPMTATAGAATAGAGDTAGDVTSAEIAAASAAPRRRARPDTVLIEARRDALAALADIARPEQIGDHRGTSVDGDRLVTHTFASLLPGYVGWNWFAVLARAPRSRAITVCEVGLGPGDGALLAPPWVPWSERLRPGESADGRTAPEDAAGNADAGGGPSGEVADGPDTARAAEDARPRSAQEGGRSTGDGDEPVVVGDQPTAPAEDIDPDLPGEDAGDGAGSGSGELSAEAETVRVEERTEEAIAEADRA